MADDSFLRQVVEPHIDSLYQQSPLLKRHRDLATIHLLRTFEDWSRFGTFQSFRKSRIDFHARLRWSHEAIPWALRWVWRDCPQNGGSSLDLDWDAYGEAAELMQLGFDYYELCRCFTLYSRGFFGAETSQEQKRVRFFFRSSDVQRRDAASMIYSILKDNPPPPAKLFNFFAESMPVIKTVLPHYIDKVGEFSIRCQTPPDLLKYFKEWAALQIDDMGFELPGTWQFGNYSLDQFRSFWMSLLTISLAHIISHEIADTSVGTRGRAVGSVVLRTTEESLLETANLFPIPLKAWKSILSALVYQPTRNFWDPFWQPVIKVSDGTLLIAPHLIISSSPQRNLITLLNRSAEGRALYSQVSSQKEEEQLNRLSSLFESARYLVRKLVTVPRTDGTTLTDIDLMLYDEKEAVLLLIHAKWLIKPDDVREVLARDQEVQAALDTAADASARITELGLHWTSDVLGKELNGSMPTIHSIVVNEDFVPGGWVYDEQIPVVNSDFFREFVGSHRFTGLTSLYSACADFYGYLEKKYPAKLGQDEIRFGEYVFEVPILDAVK